MGVVPLCHCVVTILLILPVEPDQLGSSLSHHQATDEDEIRQATEEEKSGAFRTKQVDTG
jgi:hypothetical protein